MRRDFVHALSPYYDVRFHGLADRNTGSLFHPWATHMNHTSYSGSKMSHEQMMHAK